MSENYRKKISVEIVVCGRCGSYAVQRVRSNKAHAYWQCKEEGCGGQWKERKETGHGPLYLVHLATSVLVQFGTILIWICTALS
jgi:hypothetical protein